jgi:hypothetical protein
LILAPLLLLVQAAQGAPDESTNRYIEQANREYRVIRRCDPASDPEEVVVCGRRSQVSPYRLQIRPQAFDPAAGVPSISRERHALIQEGDEGIGSCSTTGPGGFTGCFHRDTKRRCEQKPCGVAF